jgi:hypothetical protein
MAVLTGREMESLMQVLEVCLLGLVLDKELDCWQLHLNIVEQLNKDNFKQEDLDQLSAMTFCWKRAMMDLYSKVLMTMERQGKVKRGKGKATRPTNVDEGGNGNTHTRQKLSFAFPQLQDL